MKTSTNQNRNPGLNSFRDEFNPIFKEEIISILYELFQKTERMKTVGTTIK